MKKNIFNSFITKKDLPNLDSFLNGKDCDAIIQNYLHIYHFKEKLIELKKTKPHFLMELFYPQSILDERRQIDEVIDSIDKNLQKKDSLSLDLDITASKQAIIKAYLDIRETQGIFPDRLADALEGFINSPCGLAYAEQHQGVVIPHAPIKEKKDQCLSPYNENGLCSFIWNGSADKNKFVKAYHALIVHLDPLVLKTKRVEVIHDLFFELFTYYQNNQKKSEADQMNMFRSKILEKYNAILETVRHEGNHFYRFFPHSNLASALAKFSKEHFHCSIDKLITDFSDKRKIARRRCNGEA